MFAHKINAKTNLQLIQHLHAGDLFRLMESNRKYLRPWHPWVDQVRSAADLERMIGKWLQQFSSNRGFYAGIWHEDKLCGMINHLHVDWTNRSTVLSYWLDESHQGRGIMTAACREFVWHAFDVFNLNRVTIECATENVRSRKIPERLGFQFEGIIRAAEWLNDHFADHAIYGFLKSDRAAQDKPPVIEHALEEIKN
jgi:ribosomal-protein-serine acetyltransferase